jgi:hypothetical protein
MIIKKYDRTYWWRLLQLLNRHRQTAQELELSTPALFLMLANIQSFKKTTHRWRTINSLIHKKQCKILDNLGFSGSKSIFKILRKCPDSMLEIKSLIYIRKILACQLNLKILQHVKKVNTILIILLVQSDWKDYFSFNFLIEVSNMNQSDKEGQYDLYFKIKDTISMFRDLGMYEPQRQIKIRSIHHLNELHEYAIQRLYEKNPQHIKRIEFNQIVYFNTPSWLIQINDTKKLYEEGSVMRHCIYTYQDAILRGEYAAFSVKTETERATLLIKKDIKEQWRIVDIRRKFNEGVSNELRNAVVCWLNEENMNLHRNGSIYNGETENFFAATEVFDSGSYNFSEF